MNVGAVIMAAGISQTPDEFKPMLNLGSISIAQRIVTTLHQAGITKIVIVTGYNAKVLEHHLSREGIIFLRNENFETTKMFDSAKIGLAYLQNKCEAVLLTPADIPLFTARTVTTLLNSCVQPACPVCNGRTGHPILLPSSIIGHLLADTGEDGLRGALARCDIPIHHVDVQDQGILHDGDTPDDTQALLHRHNTQLIRPEVQVSLSKEKPFFDKKIAMLLTLVNETSSVLTACQRMQLSYSSGWHLINTVESQLGYLLVERQQGGAQGGKSSLTPAGSELLRLFELFEKDVHKAVRDLFNTYFSGII